ncbi:hypothetical protein BV20DRAFT_973519, partial [Pilatotrama ljubarskyi]
MASPARETGSGALLPMAAGTASFDRSFPFSLSGSTVGLAFRRRSDQIGFALGLSAPEVLAGEDAVEAILGGERAMFTATRRALTGSKHEATLSRPGPRGCTVTVRRARKAGILNICVCIVESQANA